MKKWNKLSVYLQLALCLLTAGNCAAIDTATTYRPFVVLVQLRSEHNRIAAMTRDRRYKQLEEVIHDAIAVRTAMINDFKDRFDDCPVYFYMDTNAYLVKEKKFAGILLDTNLDPIKNIIIDSTSNDYLIAYYGYPVEQSRLTNVVTDESKYSVGEETPMGKGLVILDDKYRQVNYFYKLGYDALFIKRKVNHKYYFFSKNFDMEYYTFAGLFNEKKLDRYGNHRIPTYKGHMIHPEYEQ